MGREEKPHPRRAGREGPRSERLDGKENPWWGEGTGCQGRDAEVGQASLTVHRHRRLDDGKARLGVGMVMLVRRLDPADAAGDVLVVIAMSRHVQERRKQECEGRIER